jgi:putative DNA primase/helicase
VAHQPIDFAALAAALLSQADSLVAQWLPAGVERNGRWYVGDFDGGAGESANVNLQTGQWIDNAAPDEDVGRDLISLYARIHNMANGAAARELMAQLGMDRPSLGPVQTSAPSSTPPPTPGPAPSPATLAQGAAPAPAADGVPKPRARAERWRPVVPVPPHAPEPRFVWGYKDKANNTWVELEATRHWAYRFEGQLYGYVARFERIDSRGQLVKDTLPMTWCEDTEDGRGGHRWHWKQWKEPRPLYVPRGHLCEDPQGRPVVVVEGEKCAEAGHQLLGDEFDFVSWPGGCKVASMASWAWLMGRVVYLWPDCDAKRKALTRAQREAGEEEAAQPLLPAPMQPGMRAMLGIGTELQAHQACTVHMVHIPAPGAVSDGWDIADAIAQGWDADKLRGVIRAAAVFQAPDDAARAAATGTASMAGAGTDAQAAEDAGARPWHRFLLLNSKDAKLAVRENVVLALDGLPEKGIKGIPAADGLIAFNEFTNNVELTRQAPWGSEAGPWGEADELLMGEWLVREHMLPSMPRGTLEEAVLMVARRHAYHPPRQQMLALQGTWDGTKRLDTWLARVCLKDPDPATDPRLHQYLARVGTWMVMGMCARVLPPLKRGNVLVQGPGTKYDYMPIFEGAQGWGKSTLAQILGGDYSADTGLVLGDKDSYQNLQGILVYEWGELDSLTKAEVTKVKQFVSSQKDRFRASFDRRPRDYPRQVVFVGTTNEDHYLTDPTGNRRFWPVRLTRPADLDWLRANREQMLAEALHYLAAGERFHPDAKEQTRLFDPQQQLRTVESAILSAFQDWLHNEQQKLQHGRENGAFVNRITLSDLLGKVGYSVDKQTAQVMKQAGAAMKVLGWSVSRSSEPGRPRYYIRPGHEGQADAPAAHPPGGSPGLHQPPTQGTTPGGADAPPF